MDTTWRITTTNGGTEYVIAVAGELDLATGDELRAAAAGAPGDLPVVLDLAEVTFIDSSGLRALLRARDDRAGRGGLGVARPSTPVLRLLEMTGLAEELTRPPGDGGERGSE